MQAVIRTGGKQYIVKKGDILKVEKINKKEGSKVEFKEVLLLFDKKTTKVGSPEVRGAKVEGKVLEQGKDKKVTVVKYKPKTRYHRKKGHRQLFTKVKISKVSA